MEVEKKDLEVLFKIIKETNLNLKEARVRDPFLKDLGNKLDTYYFDRKAIYEKFCKKTEDGLPDTKDDKFTFEKDVVKELMSELEILNAEVVKIEVVDGLKGFIENSAYKPEYGEIEVIDKLLCKI